MLTYPKIETLFVRDRESFKVDPDQIRMPEVELISRWLVTEKIDGTNMRVRIVPGGVVAGMVAVGDVIDTTVEFRGRTDKAQTPPFLLARLGEMFTPERCDAALPDADFEDMILFGEGYGPRIQKGGGNYRVEDVSFRLFDVAVDAHGAGDYWWLSWENVEDIARKLGIETVPVILRSATLVEAVDTVTDPSIVALLEAGAKGYIQEGIVARTEPQLFDRHRRRLIWKLKGKDFA